MKLIPRCHPSKLKFKKQNPAYTATGYLLPCCECDSVKNEQAFSELGFFDESLKVSNVETIQKIIISSQWMSFHRMLIEAPENAPDVCKKFCSEHVVNQELQYDK
jgi:hypothetical protein